MFVILAGQIYLKWENKYIADRQRLGLGGRRRTVDAVAISFYGDPRYR